MLSLLRGRMTGGLLRRRDRAARGGRFRGGVSGGADVGGDVQPIALQLPTEQEATTAAAPAAAAAAAAAGGTVPKPPTSSSAETAATKADSALTILPLMSASGCPEFSKRAGALAAALDQLRPPEIASPLGGEAAEGSCDSRDRPGDAGCAINVVDADDLLDITSAAKKLRACDDNLVDEPDSDSSEGSEESEDEVAGDGEGGRSRNSVCKRRRRAVAPEHTLIDRPPGAPAAAPASREVAAASADAEARAVGRGRKRPRDADCNTAVKVDSGGVVAAKGVESPPTMQSFGPRFDGLNSNELSAVRSRWTLHSLEDVRQTSSQENQRAAALLMQQIRSRKQEVANNIDTRAKQLDTPSIAGKPVFRRPNARIDSDAAPSGRVGLQSVALQPGLFVAQECLAGTPRIHRISNSTSAEGVPVSAGPKSETCDVPLLTSSRKRRRGVVCAALEEETETQN